MRSWFISGVVCTVLTSLALIASPAVAQRTATDGPGVAAQPISPPVIVLTGTIEEILAGPCQRPNGQCVVGVHLTLATAERGVVTLRLGPLAVLDHVVARLDEEDPIKVQAFHGDAMPDTHYVAKSITVDGDEIALRNDRLRPYWAAAEHGEGFAGAVGLGQGPGSSRPHCWW